MKRSQTIALVATKATLGASLALGFLLSPHSTAHALADDTAPLACELRDACPPDVNLTDVPVDDYPVCQQEDCSDVPNQEGLWESNEGEWYLEQGEGHTWHIVDDTVTRTLWLDPATGNVFYGAEDAGPNAIALPNQRVAP